MADEQDDRDVSRSQLALQILNQLPSVTVAQREVGDDDVRVIVPRTAVGLVASPAPIAPKPKQTKLWTYISRVSSSSSTTSTRGRGGGFGGRPSMVRVGKKAKILKIARPEATVCRVSDNTNTTC